MVLTVFLVAVGFRLAALTLPTDERRRVNRIAVQITLAAAALGIGVGLVTPLPPLATMIAVASVGAIAATAMILGQGASYRASNSSLTPGFSLSSLARRSGRLAGAHAGQATAFGGALRDLLEQFERDFGPWGGSSPNPGPPPDPRRASGRSRPAPPTPDNPYGILGVSRDDDRATVRARYLVLVKRDHPDTYPPPGERTPDQAQRQARAEANLKIITEAYRLIRVERGWS